MDELQNFAGEGSNFNTILSEAREYRLGCWLVTQYLQQLPTAMRDAVTNNCRTKLVFNPDGSDDITGLARMLHGVSKDELRSLGRYRAALQLPGQTGQRDAVLFDTYLPWTPDDRAVEQVKTETAAGTGGQRSVETGRQSLGTGQNAGGDHHAELLAAAKEQLEARGFRVNLLYQDTGDEKPDGHVHLPDGDLAHLEAEHSTLSKPAKVLTNLKRATEENREVIFVVEPGNATKLENIVADPVNRRGNDREDENGSYSYYATDGERFTETGVVEEAEYRIIELADDRFEKHDPSQSPECPELSDNSADELEAFCLFRDEDGFCTELGQPCVLTEDA